MFVHYEMSSLMLVAITVFGSVWERLDKQR